jgi:acetyl esterase
LKTWVLGLSVALNANAQNVDPAKDPHIESNIRAFLNVLNSGNSKPLEQLSPTYARAVLTGAQTMDVHVRAPSIRN